MIKRKDGRWQEQIKLPGMERPKYFYGRTQREVQRKLAAWSMEREQEQAQAVQLCTIVEQWAERHQEEISASSWQSYPAAVRDVLQWYDAGVRVKEMQVLLGHANMQTTMNIYTHIMQSRKQATADRLDRYLCQNPVSGEKDQ